MIGSCDNCDSVRIAYVDGKCSDCCGIGMREHGDQVEYAPHDMGIGGGDYISFAYCLDCGRIQGTFPLPKTEIEGAKDEA